MLPPGSNTLPPHAHTTPRRRRAFSALAGALLAASLLTAPALAPATAEAAVTTAASTEQAPYYTVQTAFSGEPEFLFAIAQRYLGDGNRFVEIFELNEGRRQPDGLALTDPTVLNPGWILQLPADATGPEVQFGPVLTDAPVTEPGTAPSPVRPGAGPADARPDAEPAPDDRPAASTFDPTPLVIVAGAVLVLAAAAVFVVLRVRRRRAPAPTTGMPADRSSSWVIDGALKIVLAASEREGIRFPGLYTVTVDDDAVHLLLTAPVATAPMGWTASTDGRTWTASLAHLQSQPVPATEGRPFARLVSLGVGASGRLLVDFARADGPISVDGDPAAVGAVIDAWVTELTDSPWSDRDQQVVRTGGREDGAARGLDALLGRLEQEGSGVLVLEAAPSRAQAETLRTLFASPDFSWVVLVKGAFGGAPWRFTVRNGVLSSGLLPDVHVTAGASRAAEPARP